MKFSKLAFYFGEIEKTASRVAITQQLADLFKKLEPGEFNKTMYLLMGRVAPLYEALEFGMAEKTVIKSVAKALNIDQKDIEKENKKIGDFGLTVELLKRQYSSLEEKDLPVSEVFQALYDLAKLSGIGSQEAKINTLAILIRQVDPLASRFLVRIPLGIMRLGFSDMTVLDALSWMVGGDKSLRQIIERAYHVRPDLGFIGALIKEKGVHALSKIEPVVNTPILMMRAERLSSGEEIIQKIGQCFVEPKYDGFRLQIHYSKKKGEVRLFTRNLENVSYMYPDLVEGVNKQIKADKIIFEGEAIAFDPLTGSFLPFQETVQRKRKYNIEAKAKEIPLKLFAFDLLYSNGKNYIREPYVDRHNALDKIIASSKDSITDTIILTSSQMMREGKKLDLMFDEYISKGLEGIIAKKRDGIYQPGARGWNWIKFKRSYSAHVEDTIDCLVMGYDLGRGKRTSFGIGAFLVGVYDKKTDTFVTIAKIGTGLTDEEWKELQIKSQKNKVQHKPTNYDVDRAMNCDVWVVPKIVVEIRADEITRSAVHTAGRVMKASKSGTAVEVDVAGYALRFPRLERFRDDKNPTDATTLLEIEKMYKRQRKS